MKKLGPTAAILALFIGVCANFFSLNANAYTISVFCLNTYVPNAGIPYPNGECYFEWHEEGDSGDITRSMGSWWSGLETPWYNSVQVHYLEEGLFEFPSRAPPVKTWIRCAGAGQYTVSMVGERYRMELEYPYTGAYYWTTHEILVDSTDPLVTEPACS